MTPKFMFDPSKVGMKSITVADVGDLSQPFAVIKEENAVPYDPNAPVDTYWDLGIGDAMAIWFGQAVGKEIRLIDYYEASGEGLNHFIKVLKEKPYVYSRHTAPHDIEVRELSTGKTRKETAYKLGIDFDVAPRLNIDEGIDTVRRIVVEN